MLRVCTSVPVLILQRPGCRTSLGKCFKHSVTLACSWPSHSECLPAWWPLESHTVRVFGGKGAAAAQRSEKEVPDDRTTVVGVPRTDNLTLDGCTVWNLSPGKMGHYKPPSKPIRVSGTRATLASQTNKTLSNGGRKICEKSPECDETERRKPSQAMLGPGC